MYNKSNQNINASITRLNQTKARNIMLLLIASVALMMSGYGIILPIFAKRLAELGSGVEALGFMTMAFAVGQLLFAPILGALSDRKGRRPVILVALVGVVLANVAFLLAQSSLLYVIIRFFNGAATAGLLPATMGVVGDIFAPNKRAQWVGLVMGSYGAGFIFGPTVGGLLYDTWGFITPFAISAGLGLVAVLFIGVMLPETRPGVGIDTKTAKSRTRKNSKREKILPRPLYLFIALLMLDFIAVFAFAFIEPQLAFFLYDELNFSTTQFGLIVGGYALSMVSGQAVLSRFSYRFGRKIMVAGGFAISAIFYFGLATFHDFSMLMLTATVAGLGIALVTPALSEYYLAISVETHRARIMGLKESAAALGSALGPLLVALVSHWTNAQTIFLIGGGLIVVAALIALLVVKAHPRQTANPPEEVLLAVGDVITVRS